MDRQTLRDWVHRYNEFGPDGLSNRPKRKVFLDEDQLKVLSEWLEKGPDPETDGLVRWRVQDVMGKIQKGFGVKYGGNPSGGGWASVTSRRVRFRQNPRIRRNSVRIFKTL